jgi:phosphoserine phosphatase RsbU/P
MQKDPSPATPVNRAAGPELPRSFEEAGLSAYPYLRIQIVEVYVRDQETSLQFYRERLGFELAFDTGQQEWGRAVAVSPPVFGSAVLSLVESPEDAPAGTVGHRTGVTLMTEDIAATFEAWSRQGVHFPQPPTPVPWGLHATFEDIDGNQFNLVQNPVMVEIINAGRRAAEERQEAERRAVLETEIARQVQARLFPQRLPVMKTLEYAGACIQARQVGGDYYDFLEFRPDRMGLVLADIAGKGVSGALLMANLQANLRSQYAMAVDDLPRLLTSVNRLFYTNTEESNYATLFFADYDDASRRLRYANCGHVPALLLRAGERPENGSGMQAGVEWLPSTCTVVGMFEAWQCETEEVELAPGDTLVLYTDGVVEAAGSDGEEFGESRLLEVLKSHPNLPADALLQAVVDAVRQFSDGEQQDDITLVVARALPGQK